MAFVLGKHLVFIDSFQFMSSSRDKLVSNLPNDAFKYTYEEIKNDEELKLMKQKGRAGGASPTTLTLVGPKILSFMVKPCNFGVLVGPVIVKLRILSNGRTNLGLLPPPLKGVYPYDYMDSFNRFSEKKLTKQR